MHAALIVVETAVVRADSVVAVAMAQAMVAATAAAPITAVATGSRGQEPALVTVARLRPGRRQRSVVLLAIGHSVIGPSVIAPSEIGLLQAIVVQHSKPATALRGLRQGGRSRGPLARRHHAPMLCGACAPPDQPLSESSTWNQPGERLAVG